MDDMWWQHKLRSVIDDSIRTCWLDSKIRKGLIVMLGKNAGDDKGTEWYVDETYDTGLEEPPQTEWKVGGINFTRRK